MLKIEGKTFMNIQEAVQWLLDNNALPFQSTANYAGNTEIGLGTIVNPSPAKVRIGSLILFLDSKISTVTGITDSSFIVSSSYIDIKNALAYISDIDVAVNGHLISTLSDGTVIDAGIIKQVSEFSIDSSQHLIATYNDGTSTDLGAIFSGNITVSGNLTVTGNITGDSIIENMSGYSATINTIADLTIENVYTSAVKNGNKLTLVTALNLTRLDTLSGSKGIVNFNVPTAIRNKLYPTNIGGYEALAFYETQCFDEEGNSHCIGILIQKGSPAIFVYIQGAYINELPLNKKMYLRVEQTFLLSDDITS